jgi:hypothetical protein
VGIIWQCRCISRDPGSIPGGSEVYWCISEPPFYFCPMGDANTLVIFEAQVKNVRKLESAKSILLKQINDQLVRDQKEAATALTKLYSLLYSTWCEAVFLKLLHTPYGFDANEIAQIVKEKNDQLEKGWEKCLQLAIKKVEGWDKSGDLPNHVHRLTRLFKEYIIDKATLRNKFAHGQWVTALNGDNNKVNTVITNQINGLDIIEIERWFFITQKFVEIIELMIETPKKHYRKNYYQLINDIDEYLQKTKKFDLATKVTLLKEKRSFHQRFGSKKKY